MQLNVSVEQTARRKGILLGIKNGLGSSAATTPVTFNPYLMPKYLITTHPCRRVAFGSFHPKLTDKSTVPLQEDKKSMANHQKLINSPPTRDPRPCLHTRITMGGSRAGIVSRYTGEVTGQQSMGGSKTNSNDACPPKLRREEL
ncbi:hypothetical protein CDAR_434481 [Caerostris darwini]|uniref:Uncharacterized protein n=1 Tax=Caerostris darwini TaxID=1538125 RepID=A0AAV4PKG1_9ARAC|nr:hypothetical protein CDAR_434481 [Caerostris darwini]